MHTRRSKALTVLVLLPALLLVSCNQGQIVTSVQLAITAAETAISVIGSQTGLSPAVLTAAVNYLQAANTALSQVTAILENGKPAAVQAAMITAALTSVLKVDLPPGAPQAVVTVLNAVANELANLLSHFATNGKPKLLPPNAKFKITPADHTALEQAKLRLATNASKIANLKKK